MVHRPGREDWSFPKGKLEDDESFEECALREVLEETGFECRLGRFVGHTEYRDRKDRPKVVAYWIMEPVGGSFRPNEEVDELRWVDLGTAEQLLSYDRDPRAADRARRGRRGGDTPHLRGAGAGPGPLYPAWC